MSLKFCHLEGTVNRSKHKIRKNNIETLSSYLAENTVYPYGDLPVNVQPKIINLVMRIIRNNFL